MEKLIKKIATCFLVLVMGLMVMPAANNEHSVSAAQKFKIHFIDVGCGDGALFQYGEGDDARYAMIDAGAGTYHETKSSKYKKKNAPAYEYLKKMGVKHLEFVILTHPHQDHIGGMIKILNDTSITINTIYGNDLNLKYLKSSEDKKKQSSETARWTKFDSEVYQQLKESIQKRNQEKEESLHVKYVVPKAGSQVLLGQAKIMFYGPLENDYKYGKQVDLNIRQVNKYSIVTKVTYGKNSFLMAGDAQKETIEKIIKKGYDLKAQVLKEPHHGYQDLTEAEKKKNKTSGHKLLIDRTKASIAIISNGYKNLGNVPLKSVLEDLSKQDIYETGDKGTIIITSDGTDLSVQTEKNGQKPSVAGRIITSGKTITAPILKTVDIKSNAKSKLIPVYTGGKNQSDVYTNKNMTVKVGGEAKSFIKISSIQCKFVKKGQDSQKVAYQSGNTIKMSNGSVGKIYIRYTTTLGMRDMKLPQITVDTKAPTKTKLIKKKSGNKIKVSFKADYGVSGKKKTQYKIVPKGKKSEKYHWKTANSVKYDRRKNKKSKLYVRFIDKAGNVTTKKQTL